MSSPSADAPITGLCIVSDPTKCPPGYEVLFRSQDKNDDCDLWKDSLFRSRVTRYICLTRVFPLEGGRLNNVLVDIVLNNDREPPPAGFSLIDFTIDSREKATRKKQICVKMQPRDGATEAICDLIILSRSKRPPSGYTLAGEMNSLLICFKIGSVPSETQNQGGDAPMQSTNQPAPNNFLSSAYNTSQPAAPAAPAPAPAGYMNHYQPPAPPGAGSTGAGSGQRSLVTRQDSMPSSVLSGVPFQLNPRFHDMQKLRTINVPEIHYRSLVDIENEYNYPFRIEKTAAARLSPGTEAEYDNALINFN